MSKLTGYFSTPISYKTKSAGDDKSNGYIGKKEHLSQSLNTRKSHDGEHSGFLGGANSPGGKSHDGEHSGFLGGSQPNGGNSHDGEHSGFLGGSQPNGGQPVGNQVINGTPCNDTLRGNNYGSDTLVLGDAQGSFYLGKGNVDYAEIHNFGRCNDLIQLAGSAQDYSISYANGISSVYHKDACGCMDLVAQVDSACSPLDLTANYFQYVTQCPGSPVLMG
jgi:hypothetical protein